MIIRLSEQEAWGVIRKFLIHLYCNDTNDTRNTCFCFRGCPWL